MFVVQILANFDAHPPLLPNTQTTSRFKVADLAQQGALADHANDHARRLVERWMGQTGPQQDRSGGPSESTSGGGDEGEHRPEDLAVLLALCGRLADGQVLLGELLADSLALGNLKKWEDHVVVRNSHAVVAAADDTADASDAAVPTTSSGSTSINDGVTQAAPHSSPSTLEEKETSAVATSAAGAAAAAPPAAHPKPSSATAEAFRQTEAFSAENSAAPGAAPIPPASANLTLRNTSAGGIVLDSPSRSPSPAAAVSAEEDSRHTAAPPDLAPESVFDDEADFLARSAAEQAERDNGGGSGGYFLDEAGGYISGFASSFAPPAPVGRGNGQQQQQQGLQEQQQRRHSEQRSNSRGAGEAAASPSTTTVSIGGLPRLPQAPNLGYEQPAAAGPPLAPAIVRYADLVEGEYTVVLFDLETTGLNADNHRIIQMAAKVRGGYCTRPGSGRVRVAQLCGLGLVAVGENESVA